MLLVGEQLNSHSSQCVVNLILIQRHFGSADSQLSAGGSNPATDSLVTSETSSVTAGALMCSILLFKKNDTRLHSEIWQFNNESLFAELHTW